MSQVRKTKSHTVELLDCGLILKIANSSTANEKLQKEATQIGNLVKRNPNVMVPVLMEATLRGRYLYIMERLPYRSLAEIVFDPSTSSETRIRSYQAALRVAREICRQERRNASASIWPHKNAIAEEWRLIQELNGGREFIERSGSFSYETMSLAQLHAENLELADKLKLRSVANAHCNFHAGNLLVDEVSYDVRAIDPDVSLENVDPLFGLSRFAFSYWHEIAVERAWNVESTDDPFQPGRWVHELTTGGETMRYPAFFTMGALLVDATDEETNALRFLTYYCFLRSIRINWSAHSAKGRASPQELLALGCITYLRR